MAALTNDTTHVAAANSALRYVAQDLDANGWLQNAVDPVTFTTPMDYADGGNSPEGQAFVLLMHAAWADFVAATTGPTA